MTNRNAASKRRVDSFSASPAIRQRAKKTRPASLPAPREALRELRRLRQEARLEIERLIEFLDATDSDPDTEDNGDTEPNLAGACHVGFGEDDSEEDDSDLEPSLGWPEGHVAHGQGMMGDWQDIEQGQFVARPKRSCRIDREPIVIDRWCRTTVRGLSYDQASALRSRARPESQVSFA